MHRHGVGDLLAVEAGAVFRLQGLELPVALVVPEQGGVAAGDGGEVQAHVGPGPPAQGVLPVAQVQPGAVAQGEPAPDLLPGFLPEQGHEAADDDENGQGDGHHPQDPAGNGQDDVNGGGDGGPGVWVFQGGLDLVSQLGKNHPQAGEEFFHGFLLSPAAGAGLRSGNGVNGAAAPIPQGAGPGRAPKGRFPGHYITLWGKDKSAPGPRRRGRGPGFVGSAGFPPAGAGGFCAPLPGAFFRERGENREHFPGDFV